MELLSVRAYSSRQLALTAVLNALPDDITFNWTRGADDDIKFDLEVKNYNDLVHRRNEPLPLHLVVVVLDAAPPACISLDEERLGLVGRAYWYLPADNAEPSDNDRQIRITIPKANRLSIGFVRERFEGLGIDL